MNKEPKVEIKVDDNKVYTVTVSVAEEELSALFISRSRSYISGGRYNINFEDEVTRLFAQEFVTRNFDEIASLIDMDTVKLLATRQLAGVVQKNSERS